MMMGIWICGICHAAAAGDIIISTCHCTLCPLSLSRQSPKEVETFFSHFEHGRIGDWSSSLLQNWPSVAAGVYAGMGILSILGRLD